MAGPSTGKICFNREYLKNDIKSVEKFIDTFHRCDELNAQNIYLQILLDVEKAVINGNLRDLKSLNFYIDFICSVKPQTTLLLYYKDIQNPFLKSNVVILTCKHSHEKILKYLFSEECNLLINLSIKVNKNPLHPGDEDDECHNAYYYAIRSNNCELLETLIYKWPEDYFKKNEHQVDELLSHTYKELKLKNIDLSYEIQFCVETILINLRFYAESTQTKYPVIPKVINERIELMIESVNSLRSMYVDIGEDDQFLLITKFIAKNLFFLKRQLKYTYSKLPWEEIEFCLTAFTSSRMYSHEFNLICNSVLNKEKILSYLGKFSCCLKEEMNNIRHLEPKKLSTLPRIKKTQIVDVIIKNTPLFEELYHDYYITRDMYSLGKIKNCVDLLIPVDCASEEGRLVIMRTVQIIGEHLKNTLESPKLSDNTCELILIHLPKNTRQLISGLRNSISHSHSFTKRQELKEKGDTEFYANIRNDIKKISVVVMEIMFKKMIEVIKMLLRKLINCSTLYDLRNVLNPLKCIKSEKNMLSDMLQNKSEIMIDEVQQLENLIEKLSNTVFEKTPYEEYLITEMKNIISYERSKLKYNKSDYVMGFLFFEAVLREIKLFKIDENYLREIKFKAQNTMKYLTSNIEKKSLKTIVELVIEFQSNIVSRADLNTIYKMYELTHEIIVLVEFQIGNVRWLSELRNKLDNHKLIKADKDLTLEHKQSILKDIQIPDLKTVLCNLRNILQKNKLGVCLKDNFLSYKNNKNLQLIIEMLVLDVMCILSDSKNYLADNFLFLDNECPLLIGKNLRNHLAHENMLFDVLQFDCSLALIINALKIISEDVIEYHKPNDKLLSDDTLNFKARHEQELLIVNLQTNMFNAIANGDIDKFKLYIKKGADVKARSFNLRTALHFAAEGGNLNIVKFLLKENLSINDKDIDGQSPLHIASAFGHENVVQFFIKELRANVVGDNLNVTPLHLAAKNGHENIIRILLKQKSNIEIDFLGCHPLCYAVIHNQKAAVQLFLDRNSVDACVVLGGLTSLHIAADNGCLEVVNLLLKNGADINAKNDKQATALHLASLNGHVDVVKTLIMIGAEINARSRDGGTPLHNAVEHGHEKIVEILLEHGAKINVVYDNNLAPINFAAKYGYFGIIKTLIKFKANINNSTKSGETPLLMAAKNGHLEIVKFLCIEKPSVYSKDIMGFTALHWSCLNGHIDIAKYLVQRGAKIGDTNMYNQTPLHLAAMKGHIEIVKFLILERNYLNKKDVTGCTALHLSSENEHLDVIKLLISNGAIINIWNKMHISPLFFAIKNDNLEIVKLLIEEGADINLTNYFGYKALHYGVSLGKKELVLHMIQHGADVNDLCHGQTPLHLAVEKNDFGMTEILIQNRANIDDEHKLGLSLLCPAVRNNNKEMVKMLLKCGADINAEGCLPLATAINFGLNDIAEILLKNEEIDIDNYGIDGNSLLQIAAIRGNCFIVELLLGKGVRVDAVNLSNNTSPLHCAADAGYVEIVKTLLNNKAKINAFRKDGLTPLHLAAGKGHTSVVKLLLENGANANLADIKNRNSVELAVVHSKIEVVKLLLQDKNVLINDKGNDGFSLLHIAAQAGNLNIVKYLINQGADCKSLNNYIDAFGQSLLHHAVLGGQNKILELLIDLKFDVNVSDRNDCKPIHVAAISGDKNALEILLQHGAYYNAAYKGMTPLQLAAEKNNFSCVQLLMLIKELFNAVKHNNLSEIEKCISEGVILNVKSTDNVTPLHYACWKGYQDIVNILLKNKADPNAIGKDGSSPLHYAAKFNHFAIVKLLLLYGGIYNASSNNQKSPLNFTSNNDIKNLLQLLEECFRKVKNGDIEILTKLQKIEDAEIIRCVMNACNQENRTLVIAGIQSNFPKMKQLRSFCKDGMSFYIEKAYDFCCKENYIEALPLLEKVLGKRKEIFGEENLETLDIQQHLAEVLYEMQNYQKALQIFEFIYQKRKELLGANHFDTLKTRECIGLVFHRLGKNEKAISIFREILPKQQEILGSNHSSVLRTQSDMALALNEVGEHEEALALNNKVLQARKRSLPTNHPLILITKNNIALVLLTQGKLNEALTIFKEVYEDRKKILGANHSHTLRTYHNMAIVLAKLKKTDDHSKVYDEVLRLQKDALGMGHRDTLTTQINMATELLHQGNSHRAKKLLEECLDSTVNILGEDHSTVKSINKMLELIQFKEAYEEGQNISTFQQSMENKNDLLSEMLHKSTEENFKINYADGDGLTLMHYAASEGSIVNVRYLLEEGIDLMLISNKGNTVLHIAASKGHIEIVELLLKHMKENNASKLDYFINAKTSVGGTTAMHIAVNLEIMTYLMKYGAIFDIKNKKGQTPLDLSKDQSITNLLTLTDELFNASENNAEVIVQKLSKLSNNEIVAIVNARNIKGNTLLENAIFYQPSEIARNLRSFLLEQKIIL
ncbi:hypothetical protein NPIL_346171 [Nephila pilipes]|uniref:Alpha-latrotoxin n=1 Tax=Nephila pilipes TaxID=299642 RepID=A0A8X6TDN6_NEPPI|nr:hypothetical protein NPIL_346171 [Nephila pilipes]